MQDTPRQFIKRLLDFSLGPIVSGLLGIITVPITTYLVSPMDFGKSAMYTMGYSISSLFIFLGMDQAFVREFNEQKNKKKLFVNSLMIPIIFSFLVGSFYIIFYKSISMFMFDSIEKYIIQILSISLPFAVVDRFNMLVIRMQERGKLYSFFNIFNKLLGIVVMIPYLKFIDNSFKGIINAAFINLIIVCFMEFYFVKDFWITKYQIDKKLIKTLFKFAIPLVPTSIITWFLTSMDRIALRQWSNFDEIGIYSAAFKIVMVLGIIQQAFSTFWTPTAYRWYNEKVDNERFMHVSDLLMTVMVLVFTSIVIFKDIIIKLLSPQYINSANVIPFLLFLPIMYTVSETTAIGIGFSKKTSYTIIISAVSVGINYIGNLLLVPKYGAVGSSVATGISYIVFFWMRTLISRKLWYKFKITFYFNNIILLLIISVLSITINNIYINVITAVIIVFYNKKYIIEIINFCIPINKKFKINKAR